MGILKQAAEIVNNGEIKILGITEREIKLEIKKYLVVFKKLSGRTIITCQCENHSRYPGAICKHKIAGITYATMRRIT